LQQGNATKIETQGHLPHQATSKCKQQIKAQQILFVVGAEMACCSSDVEKDKGKYATFKKQQK
jgi:hypothetical protein